MSATQVGLEGGEHTGEVFGIALPSSPEAELNLRIRHKDFRLVLQCGDDTTMAMAMVYTTTITQTNSHMDIVIQEFFWLPD